MRSTLKNFGRAINRIWSKLRFGLTSGRVSLRNRIRTARKLKADYVVIPISGNLPERSSPQRGFFARRLPLPSPDLSLQTLNRRFKRVAEADNIGGVLLILRELSAGVARLQNLRAAIERLQESGKTCIVYTPYLDLGHYYVASVANRIIVPPSTMFEVIGIQSEAIFLKDALELLGIEIEVIQISPYKTAFNAFDKSHITPEQAEQINWLLDEHFDVITSEIAQSRRLSQNDITQAIDESPMPAEKALELKLIDGICYEDELAELLANQEQSNATLEKPLADATEDKIDEQQEPPKVTLISWSNARGILTERARRKTRHYIGVFPIEGTIMMGESRRPPIRLPIPLFGDRSTGDKSAVATLRQIKKDPNLAALIIYVDSGGGSALASDLIWREIRQLAKEKPVLTYMGNVAASGGYYIGAAADYLMAQSLTITGSIGVITMHISTADMYHKLQVNRATFGRGKNVGLRSDAAPLGEGERQALQDSIEVTYKRFKEIVSSSRNLPYDSLDSVCGGRVWSGRQAVAKTLLDGIGDFEAAIRKATELSELKPEDDEEVSVYNIYDRGSSYQIPDPASISENMAILYMRDMVLSEMGKPWMILPFHIKVR